MRTNRNQDQPNAPTSETRRFRQPATTADRDRRPSQPPQLAGPISFTDNPNGIRLVERVGDPISKTEGIDVMMRTFSALLVGVCLVNSLHADEDVE